MKYASIADAGLVGAALAATMFAGSATAQTVQSRTLDATRAADVLFRRTPTPAIQTAMKEVSANRIQGSIERLAGFGTRHTLSETESPTRGIGAARNWIRDELAGVGGIDAASESFDARASARMPAGGAIVNVVGVLKGTRRPERAVYLVAHYDSRNADIMDAAGDAPGANDDASGTAAVLEAARVLGNTPQEATIIFLLVAGEEQSLLGSAAHASAVLSDPARPRPVAVLSNDIIGEPYGPGPDRQPITRNLVRVFSEGIPRNATAEQIALVRSLSGENDSSGRQLARYIAEVARQEQTSVRPLLVFRLDRFLRGGDHTSFVEKGFAAVRFTEVDEDYTRQHANVTHRTLGDGSTVVIGDTSDSVDSGYIADVARLNLAAAMHLASAPAMPGRARIVTANLVNDTTLRWEKPADDDLAGFELVWRATTEPEWTHAQDLGLVTEVTVPINKDNFFFGVRSYDKDGYRSLAAFPGAARE